MKNELHTTKEKIHLVDGDNRIDHIKFELKDIINEIIATTPITLSEISQRIKKEAD